MATLNRKSLLDIAKATDPKGNPAMVAEVLQETNEILQDAPLYPSNAQTGNRVTIRSSLPTVDFTKVNKGSVRSKGTTYQKTDSMGILDGRSEVDVKMKAILGSATYQRHRLMEDQAFEEAMSQAAAKNIFYGDEEVNESAFTGLERRLRTIGTSLSGSRVVSCGGAGSDNTSAYVIDWHERYAHLIYPMAGEGVAGLQTRDIGEHPVNDKDGNPMQCDISTYLWALGLTVKDPRHIGRLCNIDVSDIATAGESGYAGPAVVKKLIDLLAKMPPPNGGMRRIYCNVDLWVVIHHLAEAKSNVHLSLQEYLGQLIPHVMGYPIRRCDQITNAESAVA